MAIGRIYKSLCDDMRKSETRSGGDVRIIAKIDKGTGEIRVCLCEWKSQVYVDIRLWYEKGGEFYPGPKGLRFNAELLPEVRAALEEADEAIEEGQKIGDTEEAVIERGEEVGGTREEETR